MKKFKIEYTANMSLYFKAKNEEEAKKMVEDGSAWDTDNCILCQEDGEDADEGDVEFVGDLEDEDI